MASNEPSRRGPDSRAAKFDTDIYDDPDSRMEDYATTVQEPGGQAGIGKTFGNAQEKFFDEAKGPEVDPFAETRATTVGDRENEYQKRRMGRALDPIRADPFAEAIAAAEKNGEQSNGTSSRAAVRAYKQQLEESRLAKEEAAVARAIQRKVREEQIGQKRSAAEEISQPGLRKKSRWDVAPPTTEMQDDDVPTGAASVSTSTTTTTASRWDQTPVMTSSSSSGSRWDQTPVMPAPGASATTGGSRWDQTPVMASASSSGSRWDQTPVGVNGAGGVTPLRKSRWDETPAIPAGGAALTTPMLTPGGFGMTPARLEDMTPEQRSLLRTQTDIEFRNLPLTDEELDAILPGEKDGYEIVHPPASYQPIRTPRRKLMATPLVLGAGTEDGMYQIPEALEQEIMPAEAADGDVPFTKPEDHQYFGKLLEKVDEESLTEEEMKERQIMRLLLRVKNGTPPQRKTALRTLTQKARYFGAGPLFNQILPVLMSPTLEDQERHLFVKVIDRILYKLDDLVRPYVKNILVVIEPLLIDEDYYARVEGREIISNLSKAAGLAHMISAMRVDLDSVDEYVRNTTARAFAVVASSLGIHSLLPFLKAVCQSKKSWQARHTGIKIVQQIAILMGVAVLPHLKSLVTIIQHGLTDEQSKVRCICALALAALAEASAPYGIESFDSVLRPLWKGTRVHMGKTLAAFLKAIGYIIPLMDANYANYYTREVMKTLIREFSSSDEEMKKIVLKVVKQCITTEGVPVDYVEEEILEPFFANFWIRRMAADRRNSRQLVETTVALAEKIGGHKILQRIVNGLKDESEAYRRMVMETVEQICATLGTADVSQRLEEELIDGALYAFREQQQSGAGDAAGARVMLNGFGVLVNALGDRCKPYLPQITGIIKWQFSNKSPTVRMQAADLLARIAVVMKQCEADQLMGHMGQVLYEYLGEEYPETLGSILGALKALVNVIGMQRMTPPIKDLLPRLTPILRNRHEKVQENCIDLVGRIAERAPEAVPSKEWSRISFELLDMLKAHRKSIRRATVNTFGYIAKAIGPQDVLATLLNNLKVQERQNRVCTTVAIAIVAETCEPYTVLPALMNEYRVPELNVRNGVLKSLSFMFEYIGEMGRDYVYAVIPLLEDALMDRDLVHRQTACSVVRHLGLGVAGLSREDGMTHLLNYVFPNIFETSPHLINACFDAIEACRICLGPTVILQYLLQGLFHPARFVRKVYWKLYNSLYVGDQDALVPAYPRIPDETVKEKTPDGEEQTREIPYRRWEMEIFL